MTFVRVLAIVAAASSAAASPVEVPQGNAPEGPVRNDDVVFEGPLADDVVFEGPLRTDDVPYDGPIGEQQGRGCCDAGASGAGPAALGALVVLGIRRRRGRTAA